MAALGSPTSGARGHRIVRHWRTLMRRGGIRQSIWEPGNRIQPLFPHSSMCKLVAFCEGGESGGRCYNGFMGLSQVKDAVLDLIFPKLCAGCGEEGAFLCTVCREKMIFSAPSCPICSRRNFDGVLCLSCQEKSGLRRFFAPFSYREELVRDLIHVFKYEGVYGLAGEFADVICKFLSFYGVHVSGEFVLTPVPLHRARLRERGFNQSELLAKKLAERLNCKTALPLRRRRVTEQQIDMASYEKRRENMAGAFEVAKPKAVKDKTIILVDDVSTSGATIYECARVLREAGARTVWAIVIAKG